MKLKKINYFITTLCTVTFIMLLSGCGKEVTDPYVYLKEAVNQALNKGNWKSAQKLTSEALKLDPENLDAKIMYALTLEQNGEQTEAIKKLKEVITDNPRNFIAQLTLGRIMYDMQDYEGAYDSLSNAYSLKPDNQNAVLLFAECSSKLLAQNTDKLLKKLETFPPYKGKPSIFNEIAVYYAKTGNLKSAIENLVKAYKISPDNPTIVLNLGILCDGYLKQASKGKFFYNKFLELTNNNPAYNQQREDIKKRLNSL